MMLSTTQNWSPLKGIILLQMLPLLIMPSILRFAVELHMVHHADDGSISVVAILYRYGKPDPFLFQIKDKLAELYAEGCIEEKGDPIPVGLMDTRELRQGAHRYFRYVGSLTTPPCTENVIWNILGEIREMTEQQAAALMAGPFGGEFQAQLQADATTEWSHRAAL